MIVCIAEKPSVARDIARIIGATSSRDGYMEGNGYQVTWTFGHLCTLKEPGDYTSAWKPWVSMLLILVIAGALLFQFPVVLFTLLTLGIIDVQSMRRRRPVVIVGILILAAFLTPPDVVSQIALAVPACVFYELSILIFSRYKCKKRPGGESPEKASPQP